MVNQIALFRRLLRINIERAVQNGGLLGQFLYRIAA